MPGEGITTILPSGCTDVGCDSIGIANIPMLININTVIIVEIILYLFIPIYHLSIYNSILAIFKLFFTTQITISLQPN
jgi:hypothetical protein